MNQSSPAQGVADEWRRLLDLALETGESPVFWAGDSSGGLASLQAAQALAVLDAERQDGATPALVLGGTSPLWLAALWLVPAPQTRTPPTAILYSAPDRATHLAAQTTLETRRSLFYQRPANLPAWAQPDAAPASASATPEGWDTNPLTRFQRPGQRD
ncbi:MAG: hypothetical protein ACOYL7_17090, partial [Caldilinea sp.]